ncbi:hypothetical protein M5G07_07050 [Serratia symbiotica]|nr:hypothetical protein [Serratia symbiotica]
MIENGTTRETAEISIVGIFDKDSDAAHARNDYFLALLKEKKIGISETKEGPADVTKLINDLNCVINTMSSREQALLSKTWGLSPELLSYLRNTTSEV